MCAAVQFSCAAALVSLEKYVQTGNIYLRVQYNILHTINSSSKYINWTSKVVLSACVVRTFWNKPSEMKIVD